MQVLFFLKKKNAASVLYEVPSGFEPLYEVLQTSA
jgi:hypothetical protein